MAYYIYIPLWKSMVSLPATGGWVPPTIRPTIPCCRHLFAKDDSDDTELAASIGKKTGQVRIILVYLDNLGEALKNWLSEMCRCVCVIMSQFRCCPSSATLPKLKYQDFLAKQHLPKTVVVCQQKLECFLNLHNFNDLQSRNRLPDQRHGHNKNAVGSVAPQTVGVRAVGTTWLER